MVNILERGQNRLMIWALCVDLEWGFLGLA